MKALYFAAIAVRLLDPEELFDVVLAALEGVEQFRSARERRSRMPSSSGELLHLASRLLMLNDDGKVQFKAAPMREALLTSERLTSEKGDESIARICFQYLTEDPHYHVLKPWRRFGDRTRLASHKPFFKYASSHWHRHYQRAEHESNDLAAQLHQKIESDVKSLWGQGAFLHLELQTLCLQLGLALCKYYRFQLLLELYSQMGAGDCAITDVAVPFPQRLERTLFFVHATNSGAASGHSLFCPQTTTCVWDAGRSGVKTPVQHSVEESWTESMTDGESNLEDSWVSLSSDHQSEPWVSDFNDLRLDLDTRLPVYQQNRKSGDNGWELIDRKQHFGP